MQGRGGQNPGAKNHSHHWINDYHARMRILQQIRLTDARVEGLQHR